MTFKNRRPCAFSSLIPPPSCPPILIPHPLSLIPSPVDAMPMHVLDLQAFEPRFGRGVDSTWDFYHARESFHPLTATTYLKQAVDSQSLLGTEGSAPRHIQ
jgi:hypothetical protein